MMKMLMRRSGFATVVAAVLLIPLFAAPALAKDAVYTGTFSSLAISGYDPVAYFTQGMPVKGKSALELDYMGATWRFASKANLEAFKDMPEKYAPQYGGYCAWAVSQGYTASTIPEAWKIVDGKLYLNYSKGVQATWEKDIPGNITKADGHWPKVLN